MSLESAAESRVVVDGAYRFGGSRFQTVGPQTEKARFPNSVRLLSTTAALVDADRSWSMIAKSFDVEEQNLAQ